MKTDTKRDDGRVTPPPDSLPKGHGPSGSRDEVGRRSTMHDAGQRSWVEGRVSVLDADGGAHRGVHRGAHRGAS